MFGCRSVYVGRVAEIVELGQSFPPLLHIYEAPSCNLSCSGKAISMTYCMCAPVVLGIQHKIRTRHVVVYGLFVCILFFQIIS